MIIPIKKIWDLEDSYKVKRSLSNGLRIVVEKEEEVEVDTVFATGKTPKKQFSIDLSSEMNIDFDNIESQLKCFQGELVKKGDILITARQKNGTRRVSLKSPINGVVNLDDIQKGFITIYSEGKDDVLRSGVKGKIVSIIKDKEIVVQTDIVRIKPFKIFGGSTQGEIIFLDREEDLVIGPNLDGSLVVMTSLSSSKLLRKFALFGVKGVILNSIDADLVSSGELYGVTICAIDGYGKIDYDKKIKNLFQENENSLCFLDKKKEEILLTNKTEHFDKKNSRFFMIAKKDMKVQVFDSTFWGAYGNITKLYKDSKELDVNLLGIKRNLRTSIFNVVACI